MSVYKLKPYPTRRMMNDDEVDLLHSWRDKPNSKTIEEVNEAIAHKHFNIRFEVWFNDYWTLTPNALNTGLKDMYEAIVCAVFKKLKKTPGWADNPEFAVILREGMQGKRFKRIPKEMWEKELAVFFDRMTLKKKHKSILNNAESSLSRRASQIDGAL